MEAKSSECELWPHRSSLAVSLRACKGCSPRHLANAPARLQSRLSKAPGTPAKQPTFLIAKWRASSNSIHVNKSGYSRPKQGQHPVLCCLCEFGHHGIDRPTCFC